MKITRRNFIRKTALAGIATVIIPSIPKLSNEELAAEEIAKIKSFEAEVRKFEADIPKIAIKDYKVGEEVVWGDFLQANNEGK